MASRQNTRVRTNNRTKKMSIIAATIMAIVVIVVVLLLMPKQITDIKGIEEGQIVYLDEQLYPEYQIKPKKFEGQTISFNSSDDEVATIDADGKIKANSIGKTIITLSAMDYQKRVTVQVKSKVKDIEIQEALSITEGQVEDLAFKLVMQEERFDESKQKISCKVQDADVAKVKKGKNKLEITGLNPGTTKLKITSKGYSKVVEITVKKRIVRQYRDDGNYNKSKPSKQKNSSQSNNDKPAKQKTKKNNTTVIY